MRLFKSSNQIIAEIHNEFDTAQDRLLSQAETLLKELNIPTETEFEKTAERLEKVGFVNNPIVHRLVEFKKRQKEIEQRVVKTKEQAELIQYYKQNYPFQKFLTESELDRICKKYDLTYAPVANYIKEVPEKNLIDIERTTELKGMDTAKPLIFYKIKNTYSYRKEFFDRFVAEFGKDTFSEDEVIKIRKSSHDLANFVFYYTHDTYGTEKYAFADVTITEVNKAGLFIAAPKSHFNTSGLKKKGFGLFNITITEVKDPIVFEYCRGGMVRVLTKWGLEAKDEALLNPIEN